MGGEVQGGDIYRKGERKKKWRGKRLIKTKTKRNLRG